MGARQRSTSISAILLLGYGSIAAGLISLGRYILSFTHSQHFVYWLVLQLSRVNIITYGVVTNSSDLSVNIFHEYWISVDSLFLKSSQGKIAWILKYGAFYPPCGVGFAGNEFSIWTNTHWTVHHVFRFMSCYLGGLRKTIVTQNVNKLYISFPLILKF